MGNLKESVADVNATKANVNYTNADEKVQKAYDAAVEAANAIVAKEGTNADSTAVQAALEKVKETKAALNGDKKLEDAKQAAQDAIDKLNNLNDKQKEAAKAAVNNATDAAGVKAASNQATALDGNMGNLKESVADADTTKASGNYKNADEEAQKAYDAAVEAANALVKIPPTTGLKLVSENLLRTGLILLNRREIRFNSIPHSCFFGTLFIFI